MIDCTAFSPAYTGTVRALENMIEREWDNFVSLARRCGFIPEGYGKTLDELVLDVADALTD